MMSSTLNSISGFGAFELLVFGVTPAGGVCAKAVGLRTGAKQQRESSAKRIIQDGIISAGTTVRQIDFLPPLAEKVGQSFKMRAISRPTLGEHTAQHLREGFRRGRWQGRLPGVRQLAGEFGVSRDVVREALRIAEAEGLIVHHGPGKSRRVAAPARHPARRTLRIGILLPSPLEEDNAHTHQLISGILRAIESLGHAGFIAPKCSRQLGGKPARIGRHLEDCKADAWIIYSAERAVLEMAAQLDAPVFALGGVSEGLPLAGSRTDLTAPIEAAVDSLVKQGHRQIVLIGPPRWRKPRLNHAAAAFLDRLRTCHIRADAAFNVPEWRHTPAGLDELLRALFFATPPTALLIMEPECVGPALVFLAGHGLRVPEDVSLVNLLPDPMQSFYRIELARFIWPVQRHVNNVVRWVRSAARNQPDRRYTTIAPEFAKGESVAPVCRRR